VNPNKKWFIERSCQVHQDPAPFGGAMENFDPVRLAQMHADAGVELVTIAAFQGFCYYPSKFWRRDPRLTIADYTGSYLAELKKRGIAVFVYVGATNSKDVGDAHPDWRQQEEDFSGEEHSEMLCFNSPWRQLVGDVMAEIAEKYPIDGFFLDMFGFYRNCTCQYCVERYRRECNAEIPPGCKNWEETVERARYKRWQMKVCKETTEYLHKRVEAVRSDIKIGSNDGGATDKFVYGPAFKDHYLVQEGSMQSDAEDYWRNPLRAKYQLSDPQGRPLQFIITRFTVAWARHTLRSVNGLKYEASTIMPIGAVLSIGDTLYKDARVVEPVYNMIKECNNWMKKIRPWCFRGDYYAQVALYDGGRFYGVYTGGPYEQLSGAYRTLAENHITFDVINRVRLNNIGKYDLLVLERGDALGDEEIEALKKYVADGGNLIAFGNVGTWKMSWIIPNDNWLFEDIATLPLRVLKDSFVMETLPGAEVLAYMTNNKEKDSPFPEPAIMTSSEAKQQSKAIPAAIYNEHGKGKTVLFSALVAQAAWKDSYQLLQKLVANAVKKLLPEPVITTDLPKNSDVHIRVDGNELIVHVVHCSPSRPGAKNEFGVNVVDYDEILPIFDRTLTIRWPAKCTRVTNALTAEQMEFKQTGELVEVKIARIDMHGIFVLEFVC